jgi:hypothetical protein
MEATNDKWIHIKIVHYNVIDFIMFFLHWKDTRSYKNELKWNEKQSGYEKLKKKPEFIINWSVIIE